MRTSLALTLLFLGCGLQPPREGSPPATQAQAVPDAPIPAAPQPSPQPTPAAGPTVPPPLAPVAPFPGYALAWQDGFEGAGIDPARWNVETGPRRDAVNGPDALAVKDGLLHMRVYTEAGAHHAGFLSTDKLFSATYGYFEARIRFTSAPGEWCAFWLQSPTIGVPLGDPATAGTEIDVVEHRVTDQGGAQLADWVAQNLNWDGYGPEVKRAQHVVQIAGNAPVQGQWHVFSVLWEPGAYTFYVDAVPLWRTAQAVSRRSEFLQLTCEVLDHDWAGDVPKGGYGDRSTTTTGMDVDWVRVWQKS